MKWMLSCWLAGCGILLSTPAVVGAPDATVVKVVGAADFRSGDTGAWQALPEKQILNQGSSVRTGDNGTVTLAVGKKAVITVRESTLVKVADMQGGEGDTRVALNLPVGKVWTKFKGEGLGGQARFVVETPAAIASVRGTSFFVESDKTTKNARIGVWEGAVGVSSQRDKTEAKVVNAGFEIIVLYNKPLVDPRKMEMQELRHQQQFNEQIQGLGLASLFPAVRGIAEMNDMQLQEAERTVDAARVQQKGEKIVREDFRKLKTALARLYADSAYYPGEGANKASGKKPLLCLKENKDATGKTIKGWNGPYIDSDFKDPFGGEYTVYVRQGKTSAMLMLCSLGPDKAISEDDVEEVYTLKALQADAGVEPKKDVAAAEKGGKEKGSARPHKTGTTKKERR